MLPTLLGRGGYFKHSIKWHTHGSFKREGLWRPRLMEVWSNKMTCKSLWSSIRRRERAATCLCLHNPSILSALKNTSSALIPYHQQLPYPRCTLKITLPASLKHYTTLYTLLNYLQQSRISNCLSKKHKQKTLMRYGATKHYYITVEAWKTHLLHLSPDTNWKK